MWMGLRSTCCDFPTPSGVRRQSAGPTVESLGAGHLLSTALIGWLCLGAKPGLSSSSVDKVDYEG